MNTSKLNQWLALGANIGVLIGIMLLIYELDQNRSVMMAQTRNDISQGEMSLLTSMAQSRDLSDVIVRANARETLTPTEQMMYVGFAESTFRLWQNVHFQGVNGTYETEEFQKHLDTMEYVLGVNAGLVDYWCLTRQIYPGAFVEQINARLPDGACQAN